MTPEAKVKKHVKEILDSMGVYYFMPAMGSFGRAGIPDIIGCYNGRFVAIECKAGKGKTTALQDRELARIGNADGLAYVVNEDNLHELKDLIIWNTQQT
jgi:hypothetical protein